MRRFLILVTLMLFLPFSVKAEEESRYAAVVLEDSPSRYTRMLLDELYLRDVQVTFLMGGRQLDRDPEVAETIWEEGHEIGLHGATLHNMLDLSRRDIARELEENRKLLPRDAQIRFLYPPGGCCSDGVRQVSRVLGLALLECTADARSWGTEEIAGHVQNLPDGAVILLQEGASGEPGHTLAVLDALMDADIQLLTLSELAKHRDVPILPGRTYAAFPAKD